MQAVQTVYSNGVTVTENPEALVKFRKLQDFLSKRGITPKKGASK
ncbi:hypothetical protein [Oculatella sp. LEGE 06141]|nr:hypothetical protein [Oculatella sp. LEGE 06141]